LATIITFKINGHPLEAEEGEPSVNEAVPIAYRMLGRGGGSKLFDRLSMWRGWPSHVPVFEARSIGRAGYPTCTRFYTITFAER
jgi:hypothetical protein